MIRKVVLSMILVCLLVAPGAADMELIYEPGMLKPVDSVLKVAVGDEAPDFELPALTGGTVRLSDFSRQAERGAVLCPGSLDAGLFRPVARIQPGP